MTFPFRRFLLSTLLLSACGAPLESTSGASDEALGQVDAALCSGASVTSLTLAGVSSYGGELGAAGDWKVTSANGVRLEFLVDGQSQAVSERTSATGTWNHSSMGIACGTHRLEVRAWPMIIDSAGNRTTCTAQGPRVISQAFSQACPSASVRCLHDSTQQVTCTGSAGGGSGALTPLWQQTNRLPGQWEFLTRPWYEGTWSHVLYCEAPMYASMDDVQVQVEFKVRDGTGMESVVTSNMLYCKPYSVEQPYLDARVDGGRKDD